VYETPTGERFYQCKDGHFWAYSHIWSEPLFTYLELSLVGSDLSLIKEMYDSIPLIGHCIVQSYPGLLSCTQEGVAFLDKDFSYKKLLQYVGEHYLDINQNDSKKFRDNTYYIDLAPVLGYWKKYKEEYGKKAEKEPEV